MCPVDCMQDMKVYRMKPTQEMHLLYSPRSLLLPTPWSKRSGCLNALPSHARPALPTHTSSLLPPSLMPLGCAGPFPLLPAHAIH